MRRLQKDCRCVERKVPKGGCADSQALGLTPGVFNLLGAWPDEDEQLLHGALGSVALLPSFTIPRAVLRALMQKGLVERTTPKRVRITEKGRALQSLVQATGHWERTA